MKIRFVALSLAFAGLSFADDWGTIKGKLTWGGGDLPAKYLDVNKDTDHCLKDGKIPDEVFRIDPKTKACADVYIYLKAPSKIHPDLAKDADAAKAKFEADFEKANGFKVADLKAKLTSGFKLREVKAPALIDQLTCKYVPKAAIIQAGSSLVVLNPEPIAHNVKADSFEARNSRNPIMPPNTYEVWEMVGGNANGVMVNLSCSIHGWMTGSALVIDHPYGTVSSTTGEFEIKNVPAGDVTLLMRLPNGKWVNPASGAKGNAKGATLKVPAGGVLEVGGGELKLQADLIQ